MSAFAQEDLRAFVALLVEKGIIGPAQQERAYSFVEFLGNAGRVTEEAPEGPLNADKVKVEVSQLIQHGNRTYSEGDEIRGLILTVVNTSNEIIQLEGRRRCVLSYKIYDGDELVYDSGAHAPCTGGEKITYQMEPSESRILEMVHTKEAHELKPGTYRAVLEYPGYGSGEREFTVEAKQ